MSSSFPCAYCIFPCRSQLEGVNKYSHLFQIVEWHIYSECRRFYALLLFVIQNPIPQFEITRVTTVIIPAMTDYLYPNPSFSGYQKKKRNGQRRGMESAERPNVEGQDMKPVISKSARLNQLCAHESACCTAHTLSFHERVAARALLIQFCVHNHHSPLSPERPYSQFCACMRASTRYDSVQ